MQNIIEFAIIWIDTIAWSIINFINLWAWTVIRKIHISISKNQIAFLKTEILNVDL